MSRQTTERCEYCGGTLTIRGRWNPDKVRATHRGSCPGLTRQSKTKKENHDPVPE